MIVSMDLETSGLRYWEKDFKILSMSLAWRDSNQSIKYAFYSDLSDIKDVLEQMGQEQCTVVVFNMSFELGCIRSQFPEIPPLNFVCAQRLSQLNGLSPKLEKKLRKTAFSLENSAVRILQAEPWKQQFKNNVRDITGRP